MRGVAILSLVLILMLVSLSAYLRLDHSGIGCEPWPACYGQIGTKPAAARVADAYERLVAEATQPMSWARPAHRLIASILGLLVLALAITSVLRREQRLAALLLLVLTVFLAWIGIYSEGLHSPAIVMGNLGGGFAMLAVCGWMVFDSGVRESRTLRKSPLAASCLLAVVLLSLQILVGGLTSANFAASACTTVPQCNGSLLPGGELWSAFDLSRDVAVSAEGFAIGGAERPAIHQLHRLLSVFAVAAIAAAAWLAQRARKRVRIAGIVMILLALAQVSVGVIAVRSGIPIVVAVSHNWIAAVMLLGLIYMYSASRRDAMLR
ncbi:MAG: COX15/CtaA family protein [Gammaproteobacteria bacterium]|nr:COX15/CtaA family protein [Gammaproteobacteria bacterium]